MFFYGHPKNRFWQVIAAVFERSVPETVENKRKMLYSLNIALWDVIRSCDIAGSSDSSIKNAVPNDLFLILNSADIKRIFLNGRIAEKYYNKYFKNIIDKEVCCLPSTSPANAAWTLQKLIESWSIIKE